VRILLDTHVFLWMHAASSRLGDLAALVTNPKHDLFLSAASSWEIAIKSNIGKLRLPEGASDYVQSRMADDGVNGLPIEHVHALFVDRLPLHHRDPFDRLLVAQAELEELILATADPIFASYTDRIISP